jgi:hypothetical protein
MPVVEPRKSNSTPRILATFSLILVSAACSSSGSSGATATGTPTAASSRAATAPGTRQTPVPVESNPPGDIPDNVAYVLYRNTQGGYQFLHPEGWASVTRSGAVYFTDKLNGISVQSAGARSAPSVADAHREVTALASTQAAFELRSIKSVALPGGNGVLIVFRRNSAPDAVTGRSYRDEVNRYEIFRGGRLVTLELYGAVGSDNVDPYFKISQSLVIA